jgi:uncharacterized membrane protein
MKFFGIYLLGGLYVFAGIFHFIYPPFYFAFIPSYFHYPYPIIYFSGLCEFLLGMGVLVHNNKIRKQSLQLIIAMLIVFIPAHIQHIQNCSDGNTNIQLTFAYIRLIIGHPLLIYWTYSTLKKIDGN